RAYRRPDHQRVQHRRSRVGTVPQGLQANRLVTPVQISNDLLLDLFDHMETADAAVWAAALKHEAALGDPQVRTYLLHISSVQRAFLDAWKARPFAFRDTFDGTTLPGEFAAVRRYYPEARQFLAGLDEAALAGDMRLPWVSWIEQHFQQTLAMTTLGETMLQVFSHTTH